MAFVVVQYEICGYSSVPAVYLPSNLQLNKFYEVLLSAKLSFSSGVYFNVGQFWIEEISVHGSWNVLRISFLKLALTFAIRCLFSTLNLPVTLTLHQANNKVYYGRTELLTDRRFH